MRYTKYCRRHVYKSIKQQIFLTLAIVSQIKQSETAKNTNKDMSSSITNRSTVESLYRKKSNEINAREKVICLEDKPICIVGWMIQHHNKNCSGCCLKSRLFTSGDHGLCGSGNQIDDNGERHCLTFDLCENVLLNKRHNTNLQFYVTQIGQRRISSLSYLLRLTLFCDTKISIGRKRYMAYGDPDHLNKYAASSCDSVANV